MITCDKCAYCSPTPGGSLYCALTDHFVPNLGCENGEPINKAKSNGDRIRAMSDEELAIILTESFGCPPDGEQKRCFGRDIKCYDCALEWLKEEVCE